MNWAAAIHHQPSTCAKITGHFLLTPPTTPPVDGYGENNLLYSAVAELANTE